jgi:SAM-dependent methyltransferase
MMPRDTAKRLVHRIEDGMDRREVYATTYQMRNFYSQLRDGYFTDLDVMNYCQHLQVARWAAKQPGAWVLDVCCGRGLLLPLLRYHAKGIGGYVGVDIAPQNAVWRTKRVTDGQPIEADYYPFPARFVESDVADMAQPLGAQRFQLIVYTSALEHMQPATGQASLVACRQVAAPGARLLLTTPRTDEQADGYDARYRAHVYEWKRSELLAGLDAAGWRVVDQWGLVIPRHALRAAAAKVGAAGLVARLERAIPVEFLTPVLAPLFPEAATELAIVAEPKP